MSSENRNPVYYFDNNATTRVAPEVVEAMIPMLTEHWGNPSSVYEFGRRVNDHIERAREQVATLIHADPREIIFTSCGTESNNAAISSALKLQPSKRHVVTTAVEHSANIKFCRHLQQLGHEVTFLPVEPDGSIDLYLLEKSIRPDTAIVSCMWANNETGVLFPVAEMAAICHSRGTTFHTDAVQVPGKLNIDVRSLEVDYLSLSAHKLHAPKGVGMLYVRKDTPWLPYIIGGGQERGCRGGTENVANIVGFGRAAELAVDSLHEENTRTRSLRNRLENTLLKQVPGAARNGARHERLPNTSNLSFEHAEAGKILKRLDELGICASSGSACTSGSPQPSHVLVAMGMSQERALGSIRFSLGRYNTEEEVDYLLKHLPRVIREIQAASDSRPASAAGALADC